MKNSRRPNANASIGGRIEGCQGAPPGSNVTCTPRLAVVQCGSAMVLAEQAVTVRIISTMAMILLTIAASPGAYGQNIHISSPLSTSPAPASADCWIYAKIYPATRDAFESQHVTRAQQLEILKWARPVSPAQTKLVKAASPWATPPSAAELGLVRWMRSDWDQSFFVFVARPLFETDSTGHRPWLALDGNVFIDPVNCQTGAYPTA